MSNPALEVEFSGKSSGVSSAANEAAAAVKASIDKMKDSMASLGDSAKNLHSHMNTQLDGVGNAFKNLNGVVVAVASAIAGGAMFKAAVDETVKFTKEANALARALGMTASEASVLNVALGDIHSSAEEYQGAFLHFARQLKMNSDGLRQMGVDVDALRNGTKSSSQVFQEAIAIIKEYKPGLDQMQAAMVIGGRSVEGLMKLQKLNNEVMEQAREKAESLGLVVGQNAVANTAAYRAAMNDVGDVMLAIKKAIGDALLPVLTRLAEWFASIGPAVVTVFKGAIGGVAALFHGLVLSVELVIDAFKMMWNVGAEAIGGIGDLVQAVVEGRFYALPGIVSGSMKRVREAASAGFAEMESDAAKTQARLLALFDKDPAVEKKPQGGKTFTPKEDAKEDKKEKSKVADWENENKEAKATYQLLHNLKERDLAEDVRFWKEKLAIANVANGDRAKVQTKVAEAELANQKKIVQQQRDLDRENISELESASIAELDRARIKAETLLATGRMTQAEFIRYEQELEDKKYQIHVAAQQALLKLVQNDPNHSPAALQKEKDKLLEIERAHQKRRLEISKQAQVEEGKYQKTFVDSASAGIGQLIGKFATGTLTIKGLFQGMFQAILNAMAGMIAQMATDWLKEWLMEKVGIMSSSVSKIMANASVAGSAAYAAIAGIPVVGPAMAPAAAAAAYAGAASYATGVMASARGGYDIPAGVNPLTQLHEKEMVLPEKQANAVRDMAEGKGGGGGDVHFHVTAMDARSVKDFFKSNSHNLAPALRQMARNFTPRQA